MSQEIRVLGIGGSLGKGSTSLAALKITLEAVKSAGTEVELIDLQTFRVPMYEPSLPEKDLGPEAKDLLEKVRAADGMIWSSPGYHGTISGAMKNLLDYLEYLSVDTPSYLTNKIIGVVSTGAGTIATVNTVNTLADIAHALRAWVCPLMIPIPQAWQIFDQQGRISDAKIDERLQMLGKEVVGFMKRQQERT
ncbi:MAG: NAD(P)H-dependent oxidoreductase [Candidatus Tectomicrobia bacterium]|nr:NAD(P)H-dependent oxidoreductase [Candidatus Tectomicrobia bacterium]